MALFGGRCGLAEEVPGIPGTTVPPEPPAGPDAAAAPAHGGKYRIEGSLGSGGMGDILLVEDRELRRQVAMKVLKAEYAATPALRAKFVAEAQATGQLDHPGIPPVHEMGVDGKGRVFFTMKAVRGRTLREILRDLLLGSPPSRSEYTLHRLVTILERVGEAVHFSHEKGVVHRDIKPENIMIGSIGEVHVMDWGVAKITGSEDGEAEPEGAVVTDGAGPGTQAGTLKGTLPYMSPEQALGRQEQVDRRSDVYALGCLLYEILTLSPAFAGERHEVLGRVVRGEFVPVGERNPRRPVPGALAELCAAAMSRTPEARPPTALAFVARLRSWLDGTAEAELRLREAEELTRQGREAARHLDRIRGAMEAAAVEAREAAGRFRPWQPLEEKGEALAAEQRVRDLRLDAVHCFSEATRFLNAALAARPGHPPAQEALAELWKRRLEEAEREGELEEAAYAERLVARHDDGRLESFLVGDGTLAVESDPPGADVLVERLTDRGGLLVPGTGRSVGRTPLGPTPLAMGSYIVLLRKEGFPEVRYPVHIARCRAWAGRVRLRTAEEVGEGFVLVPGGPFLFGEGVSATTLHLPDFAIGRCAVTFREYGEFLAALDARDGPRAAAPLVPGTQGDGPLMVRREDGTYAPSVRMVEGAERERCVAAWGGDFELRLPVVGVSRPDAEAYCAWRTETTGRPWRLPTEQEREKAARGVDGRRFPWGSLEDASLGRCQESREGRGHPEPVGSFPRAASVYGLEDAAGNTWDWTASWFAEVGKDAILRGGSWGNPALSLRCANRRRNAPGFRNAIIGFRCARSLPSPEEPPPSGR